MGAAICMKISCLYMYACVHVCVRAHAHVHAHVRRAPPNILTESHPHPPTPTPCKGGTPGISQNSIALERIEIIQFRLKILDL